MAGAGARDARTGAPAKTRHTVSLVSERLLSIGPSSRGIMGFLCNKEAEFDLAANRWTFSVGDYAGLVGRIKHDHQLEGPPASLIEHLARAAEAASAAPPQVDATIRVRGSGAEVPLFAHQIEGLQRMCRAGFRLLIADDMGLGKTIQSLAAVQHLMSRQLVRRGVFLVIATTTLVAPWRREIEKYLTGTVLSMKEFAAWRPGAELAAVLDTYDMVRKYLELRGESEGEPDAGPFFLAIVDESHYLKELDSKRSSVLVPFLARVPRVILLSGTPALSRPVEMYGQISIVRPGLFARSEYCQRYCELEPAKLRHLRPQLQRVNRYKGGQHLDELKLALQALVMIRREKGDCPDLAGKQRFKINFERLGPGATSAGEELASGRSAPAREWDNSWEARGKPTKELLQQYQEASLEKLDEVIAYLSNLRKVTDKKMIVFAHHKEMLAQIQGALGRRAIKIDGDTPKKRRDELCEEFKVSPAVDTAVLSITTCSTGLNLACASIVVFAELYWNPGQLLQAEDRVYRIGQRDPVKIYYLLGSKVDQAIWRHLQRKIVTLKGLGVSTANSLNFIEHSVDPRQHTFGLPGG